MDLSEVKRIKGQKGSKSHTPVDSPNTLKTKTTAKVLFLLSAGECGGLYNQSNPLKSVYFDNTPVVSADGTTNVANTTLSERYGLPSQSYMTGYPSASNTATVGTKVTTSAPAIYTTTASNIDAIRVTVRFPALFEQKTNGDTVGTSVRFQIYKQPSGGSWTLVKDITQSDKCTSAADLDYYINRPGTSGVWSVKVVRVTADNASTTKANDIYFQYATEVQEVQLPYNGFAYIGLTTVADSSSADYPTVSYDFTGRKISVPSNYTVSTRTYTGTWDGTFSTTKYVCDNPAWVLYDLLTDETDGLGISASNIDIGAFYDAAVYCDGLVPTANGSGTEPRYTFNYQFINDRKECYDLLAGVAASFHANLFAIGDTISITQDRPTAVSRLITNSNVINGVFEYVSASLSTRYSAAQVFWNDPSQNDLSVPSYYEDSTLVAKYGLQVSSVTAIGCTSEGQALRYAKWIVDTANNNTETVTFDVSLSNAGFLPGDVFNLMDTSYAESMNEAKVVSVGTNTLTVDRALTVAAGYTFDVLGSDGVTIQTRTISAASTGNTLSFSGAALDALPGADLIVTGAVAPRPFRVTSVKEVQQDNAPTTWTITAAQYDANKFGRVDNTPTGITQVYQAQPSMASVPVVTGITFSENSYIDADGTAKRYLNVTWTPPANTYISSYRAYWFKDNGTVSDLGLLYQTNCRVPIDSDGTYTVTVYATNARGVSSPAASASQAVSLTAPGSASALSAVSGLKTTAGSTTFTGTDCNVVWTDSNANGSAVVAGYVVQVCDASTPSTVYRTETVKTAKYTYDLTKQQTDNGSSYKRSFIISVRVKDTFGRLSAATSATFTNPAPAAVGGITLLGGVSFVSLNWTASTDADIAGYLVWRSSTSGFTPSATYLVYDGLANYVNINGTPGATYYFKIAAYDRFGKAISDLNISSEYSCAVVKNAGIPQGASLPSSGNTVGDLFFNTTDTKLYRYTSSGWTAAVPSSDITGTLSDSQIAALAASKLTGQVTGTQIADGSISTPKLVANSVTADKLVITGRGKALNDDPAFLDSTAWLGGAGSGAYSIVADSTAPIGSYSALITGPKAIYAAKQIPISAGTTYKVSVWARQTTASGSTYIRLLTYNSAGTQLTYTVTGLTPTTGSFEGITISSSWTKYVGYITAPTNAVNGTLALWANWGGSGGVTNITDFRCEEYIGADLIVDGSISATKLVAGSVTATQIAAGTITGDKLVAGTITAAQIASGTITATQIATGTITANQIAAGTITGTQIAANTITADKIDSRGLSIKDASGNVILAAGTALDYSMVANGPSASATVGTDDATVLGFNPSFSNWTSTLPTGWSTWTSSPTKETSIVRGGPYSVKCVASGTNGPGLSRSVTWGSAPLTSASVLIGSVDCYLGSVTSGLPGVVVRLFTNSSYSTYAQVGAQPANVTTGIWQRIPFSLRVPAGSQIYGVMVYIMGSWTGFSSGAFTGTCYFSNLRFDIQDGAIDNTQVGINADGTLSGAGGGKVTIGGLGYSGDLNATNGATAGTNIYDPQGNLLDVAALKNNLIDPSYWAVGVDPFSTGWGKNQSGTGAADSFVNALGPSDQSEILWQAVQGSGSNNGGGWTPGGTNWFSIDSSKTYRFCVPIYVVDATGGSAYWGINGNAVCNLNTTTQNSNPYFVNGYSRNTIVGKWCLFVGYVFPAGSTGNTADGAGVYDMTTGAKLANGANYCWYSGTTGAGTRAYQYYASAGAKQIFGKPMVHMVNGSEPSLDAILASGAVSARNPITASTATTYIANAAINTAQIGTLDASVITAGTITAAKIASGTITATQIAAGTITATQIAASTITGAKIAAGTITASNIAAGTITATQIATNTITTNRIVVGAVSSPSFVSYWSGSYSGSTTYSSGPITILTVTTSGGSILISGELLLNITVGALSTVDSIRVTYGILVDGTYIGSSQKVNQVKAYGSTSYNFGSRVVLPMSALLTSLAAGSHDVQFAFAVDAMSVSGSTGAGVSMTIGASASLGTLENKV